MATGASSRNLGFTFMLSIVQRRRRRLNQLPIKISAAFHMRIRRRRSTTSYTRRRSTHTRSRLDSSFDYTSHRGRVVCLNQIKFLRCDIGCVNEFWTSILWHNRIFPTKWCWIFSRQMVHKLSLVCVRMRERNDFVNLVSHCSPRQSHHHHHHRPPLPDPEKKGDSDAAVDAATCDGLTFVGIVPGDKLRPLLDGSCWIVWWLRITEFCWLERLVLPKFTPQKSDNISFLMNWIREMKLRIDLAEEIFWRRSHIIHKGSQFLLVMDWQSKQGYFGARKKSSDRGLN